MNKTHNKIKIYSTRTWEDMVQDLRRVSLNGDPTLLPYIEAKISTKIVNPSDIRPLALYALKSKINLQRRLRRIFIDEHNIDTLDQDGNKPDFTFSIKGEKGLWTMAPPIVEVSKIDGNIPILLDGEHRFQMARLERSTVRVIWIEDVSRRYPVVGKPAQWDEVKIYKEVPKLLKKRHFRFNDLSEFPNVSSYSSVKVDKDNFRYFFYRNLNSICTSGIREPKS
ncbi:hypothetical protein ACFL1A_00380 [Patescibacteria group bacterium]